MAFQTNIFHFYYSRLHLEMKISSNLLIFASLVTVLIFKIAYTGNIILMFLFLSNWKLDAAPLVDEKSSMIESSASDENDASLRDKKDAGIITPQHIIPSPLRRHHHLKFGVLGKRYSYDYSGKQNESMRKMKSNFFIFPIFILVPELGKDFEEWMNYMRERRAGRPVYGLLG